MIMKRSCVALALVLQLLSGVSARSSVFARNGDDRHGVAPHQAETDPEMFPSPKHPRTLSERAQEEIKSSEEEEEEEDGNQMGVSKIGSSPPSCEHKCYGCTPCEATQVPASRDGDGHAHVRVQYTNYEPEDWKCKCGPSLYTP